jgi:predicted permease
MVAVAGGAAGLVFTWLTIDMLSTFIGRFTARTGEIDLDPWVLAFTLGISLATGLAFGTFPALASRVNLVTALKGSGKGTGESGGRRRLQSALIVAQVAVSVVLLVAAGLLLLSFYKLQRVDPGYQGDRVLSAEIFGNFSKYPNPPALRRLYTSVLERLESSPGVLAASITNGVPLSGIQPGQTRFQIRGVTEENPDLAPTADVRVASPRYFETLGIPVRSGRAFVELDHEEAPRVVVINESMVRYWNGRDPIGSEISLNNGQTWSTVVGVVGDVKAYGLDREAVAQVYTPLRQAGGGLQGRALVRMNGDAAAASAILREAVHAIDPDVPIENVRTMAEIRNQSIATPRLTASLLAVFAGLALLVTVTGITGVIAMVLRQGLWLVGIGLAIGLAASLALVRVLQTYLYDTAPTDPLTFAVVAVAFLAAGSLAALGPAWRATRVDPMLALRSE